MAPFENASLLEGHRNSDKEGQPANQIQMPLWATSLDGQQFGHGPIPYQIDVWPLQQQMLLAMAQENASAVLALQHAAVSCGVTHNMIQQHLQGTAMPTSFNSLADHQSTLILQGNMTPSAYMAMQQEPPVPVLTVQDRPHVPPVYNGVNLNYPGLHIINAVPPIYVVDNFLTPYECEFLVAAANDSWSPAPVVGKGTGEISSSRTSSTCYLAREDLPDYMRKVSLLTGKPIEHCELPQVGRYLHTQQYLQVSLSVCVRVRVFSMYFVSCNDCVSWDYLKD